jgi:K+-transporting ATPase KdpF subunit
LAAARSQPLFKPWSGCHERHRLHVDFGRIFRDCRGLRLFLRKGALKAYLSCPTGSSMETFIFGLIALALLLYLVVAVLRPEWF